MTTRSPRRLVGELGAGLITGQGLAANMRRVAPRWLTLLIVLLLLGANWARAAR